MRYVWSVDRSAGDKQTAALYLASYPRTKHMKTTAFALIAVSTLGLAACGDNSPTANVSNTSGATTNEAVADVNAASATDSALDANANMMASEIGGNVTNTADAAVNSATSTGNTAADMATSNKM